MALIQDEGFEKPYLLDIIQLDSKTANQYDLPFYYFGQVMTANFEYETAKNLEPFGKANGYQHLWKEGSAVLTTDNAKFSWLSEGSFYTLTSATQLNDEMYFVRTGAHDPNFNLRRDPGLVLRRKNATKTTFVSLLETHGSYSTVTESAKNASSSVETLKVVYEDNSYIAVEIKNKSGVSSLFILATKNNKKNQKHQILIGNKKYNWVGAYKFTTIK
jgi:hypothetical protein